MQHPGNRRDRSAGADQATTLGLVARQRRNQGGAQMIAKFPKSSFTELLSKPQRAQRQTLEQFHLSSASLDKLGAAAAHVHDQNRFTRPLRITRHPLKNQLGFALAGDQLHFQPARLTYAVQKLVTVHRVARRTGGQRDDLGHSKLPRFQNKVSDGLNRPGDGRLRELFLLVHTLTQPCRPILKP